MSQNIEDKVINHLVADYILVPTFEKKYLDCMCATRVGKGTHYGICLLVKYLNDIKRNYNNFYILKLDIKKYFYNIDHDILKRILKDNIKDKDALLVLNTIIDSTNKSYINKEITLLKNKRINYIKSSNLNNKDKEYLIDETNNIPLYEYNKGLPIGYSNF